ncbi:MAG TPA: hypothetical protein VLA61_28195 [Ideonella sp.]|uniref:hypothetical protein n=1 Tax=Ideonella sp. TaxID=1929293 RepID=UPI002C3E2299|nr:hypothetical protein [Ideonella sp.]HSI52167.1 hypothetical protein [Ideonella sp.]
MKFRTGLSPLALAAIAAIGSTAAITAPTAVQAASSPSGKYVTGDFHNHTTCSDGTISMQKLVSKVTDKTDGTFGLDWFVQAGHGGNGNRNCTLVEDATLSTPAYPFVEGQGPTTTWTNSIGAAAIKGDGGGVGGNGNMWRWQSIQEYQYPLLEYLSAQKNVPLFIGMESVVAGHEHSSMSVVTGQMPKKLDKVTLPTGPGYKAVGNANALAQWSYCFDRGDTDTSRGNTTGTATGNNWDCSVAGSLNAADPSWNATAHKLIPASGTGSGNTGHAKTVEALKWMAQNHGNASYYVPAHLERAGPFNPDGNNGFNIEHLRDFNNAAPNIAFGFETHPGHGAANNRGEYQVLRNTFPTGKVDSVGGTTYGGTGVYGGVIGGVWDALLGEGRNYWFFSSSDWHNRGIFGPDDRRSSQDFYPGEYQRDFVMVRNGQDKLRPQTIVDGLRTGNSFAVDGQLIDRLGLVVCKSNASAYLSDSQVRNYAYAGAEKGSVVNHTNCVSMGEKLVVDAGDDVVIGVSVRDPAGTNFAPYSFANPSLAQVGMNQPINKPVLDHVDLIRGMVSGYKTPGAADYSGEWPRNTAWLSADGVTADLAVVPAAAKNTSAAIVKTFSAAKGWNSIVSTTDGTTYLRMSYRLPAVVASQYVRLRGSNLPAATPYETDASGNPLSDLFTNANDSTKLRIPCTVAGTNVPENGVSWTAANGTINGCPNHLAVVNGQKMVSYDVAAWSDLWFYSNPVYVEVNGSVKVAGVK